MKRKEPSRYFGTHNWTHTSDERGNFTGDQIQRGAAIDAAATLRDIAGTLTAILSRLDQLGNDGIHTLVQEHARIAARMRTQRHLRAKKARAKLRAARESA